MDKHNEGSQGAGSGKDTPNLGLTPARRMLAVLVSLGVIAVILAPFLDQMLGPLLAMALLGLGMPWLSRQAAVHADSVVEERAGCLVITTPRPSKLRKGALTVLAFVVFFAPGLLTFGTLARTDDALPPLTGLVAAALGPLALVLLPVLVLVLLFGDRTTVQRVVWGHPRLYRSVAMGPLELFTQRVPRRPSRPPVLVPPMGVQLEGLFEKGDGLKQTRATLARQGYTPEQVKALAAQYLKDAATYGQLHASTLYWTVVLPGLLDRDPGERMAARPQSLELARFSEEAPARTLLARLLASQAPLPRNLDRVVGQDGIISRGLSTAAAWLLRAPLFAGLLVCLVAAWLAAQAHLTVIGRLAVEPPWDTVAQAQLERFEWLVAPWTSEDDPLGGYTAHTLVEVQVQVGADGDAAKAHRPLAWPHYGQKSQGQPVEPGKVLEDAARSGLVPTRLDFAIPRQVLDIEVDEHGVLRFDRLEIDRARGRGADGPYRRMYFGVLGGLDTLDRSLPIHWMQPGVDERFRVVYRADEPAGTPVQREADALAATPARAGLQGSSAVLGGFGVALGLLLVAGLAALNGHWQAADWHRVLGMLALWLLVCASALYWMPRHPALAGWLGMDSAPVSAWRAALQGGHTGEAAALPAYDDADLVRGHWAPVGSRHARWLAVLDLLEPPAQRADSFEAATRAVHAALAERLAALDWPQRLRFLARYRPDLLRDNGSSAMHDAVIAPAICAWQASGDPQAEGMQRYRAVLSYARCG